MFSVSKANNKTTQLRILLKQMSLLALAHLVHDIHRFFSQFMEILQYIICINVKFAVIDITHIEKIALYS